MTKLARARVEAGLTQFQVSQALGISEWAYGRLERDERDEVPLNQLVKLTRVLQRPLEELAEDHWLE